MADKKISEEKMLQFFRSYGSNINMTLDDLRSPKPPIMVAVLESFLKALEVDTDCIYTPPLCAFEGMENKELYEEALSLASFKFIIDCTVQFTGIKDFGILDFLEPKPKRTKKILHYLITLWHMIGMKGARYNEVVEKYDAETQAKHQVVSEIEETDREIEEKKHRVQQLKKVAGTDAAKNERLKELTEKKDAVVEQYQSLKAKEAALLKTISDSDVKMATIKERFAELNRMLITSPQRLSEEVESIKQKIIEMDDKGKDIHLKTEVKKKQSENLVVHLERLIRANELVEENVSLCEELKKESMVAVDKQNNLKAEGEKIKKRHVDLEKEKDKKYLDEELYAKGQLSDQKRITALEEIIAMNEKSYGKMTSVLDTHKEKKNKNKEVVEENKRILSEVVQQEEENVEEKKQKFESLGEIFDAYMEKHHKELDETNKIFDQILEE